MGWSPFTTAKAMRLPVVRWTGAAEDAGNGIILPVAVVGMGMAGATLVSVAPGPGTCTPGPASQGQAGAHPAPQEFGHLPAQFATCPRRVTRGCGGECGCAATMG